MTLKINLIQRLFLTVSICTVLILEIQADTKLIRFPRQAAAAATSVDPNKAAAAAANKTYVAEPYYVGSFDSDGNEVSGDVTILDDKTIKIKDFDYDGRSKAFFVLGYKNATSLQEYLSIDSSMVVIPDETGSCDPLSLYQDSASIRLKIPGSRRLSDFNYLMIYSIADNDNLGYVFLPSDVMFKSGESNVGVSECSSAKELDDNSDEETKQDKQREAATDQILNIGANLLSNVVDLFI